MITTVVGLIHFAEPLGSPDSHQAQHYLFSTGDLDAELTRFRNRPTPKIMAEVNRRGIAWELVRTWPGSRVEERRLKNIKDAVSMCPACGVWPRKGMSPMRGGYAVVAAAINGKYAPEPPVTRGQVHSWDKHQTRNRLGHTPPEPVELRPKARRTTPSRVFEAAHWLAWFGEGVRGPRRRGWVIHEPLDAIVPLGVPVETVDTELV